MLVVRSPRETGRQQRGKTQLAQSPSIESAPCAGLFMRLFHRAHKTSVGSVGVPHTLRNNPVCLKHSER